MKQIKCNLILCLGLFLCLQISGQTNSPAVVFTLKIQALLSNIAAEGDIKSYRLCYGRVLRIKGSLENGTKEFRQKVTVFKSGTKRTRTEVFVINNGTKLKITDITQINNSLFCVKYNEMSLNKAGKSEINYEEVLLNENEYQKNYYNR